MMHKFAVATLCFSLAVSAFGQQPSGNAPLRSRAELTTTCDGAWKDVHTAIDNLKRLDLSTNTERERLTCLLEAIGATTFDSRDSNYNQLFFKMEVESLVHAYGLANYDYFATQMRLRTGRLHDALRGVLLKAGHPEAFRDYFAEQRLATSGAAKKTQTPGVARFWAPFIEDGKCLDAACSPRLPETLAVIRANLDLVAKDLEVSAKAAPTDASPNVQRDRREDERLLSVVGRVERGELAIGRVR